MSPITSTPQHAHIIGKGILFWFVCYFHFNFDSYRNDFLKIILRKTHQVKENPESLRLRHSATRHHFQLSVFQYLTHLGPPPRRHCRINWLDDVAFYVVCAPRFPNPDPDVDPNLCPHPLSPSRSVAAIGFLWFGEFHKLMRCVACVINK